MQLLDFYHAAEHLYQTAAALWPQGIADSWWHRRLEQLKSEELGNFFAALKLIAKRHETNDPAVSPSICWLTSRTTGQGWIMPDLCVENCQLARKW